MEGREGTPFLEFNLDPALAETVDEAPAEQIVEGVIRLEDPRQIPPQFTVITQFQRICTGRFRAGDVLALRRHPNVISLKAARPVGIANDNEFGGRGCIVAALDFGLDFAHPNFLNRDGSTRLLAFWHQGAAYEPAHPNAYGYGRMFSRADINAALRTANPYQTLNYHPALSDTGSGSHGTHTLDIAAGNGFVGRRSPAFLSDLMFVHLSTPRLGFVGDLGDSVRMLEALDWVDKTADGRPWVVNLSVGRTAGSHDGTSPVEQGMHELLRLGPGRAIVQSAGNYRSANLAVQGRLRDGERRDLEWIIDPQDTTDNEMDIWYSGKDRFVVAVRPPGGSAFVRAKLGESADIVHEGALVGRVYHRMNDPNNRDNHGEIFLYPNAPHGAWIVRLVGEYVISGRFHAWIERDLASPGAQSRFDATITSQSYTLGTIATSPLVITVGAYDANSEDTQLAPFSSRGPTRDERRDKPELLAPGVDVVAARSIPRGALRQEGLLVARSGTSMAAPHVTGTVAAMFEAAGRPVTIDEIRDCLRRSAQPLQGAEYADCWGRLDTARAIQQIQQQPQGSSIEGEALMNSDSNESVIARRESEHAFLQRLLRNIGGDDSTPGLSPASLFRAAVNDGSLMQSMRGLLTIVAKPMTRPADALRPGDWMLRVVPGTGDVGHISVLASSELMTQTALATEDIPAESEQSGYYGLVIEGGAFPHSRTEPFARRLLDSRGLVPPHTVILRPMPQESTESEDSADSAEYAKPAWLKVQHRSAEDIEDIEDIEDVEDVEAEPETMDVYQPPAWLKVQRRGRNRADAVEFEDSEAFTFEPTGGLKDFDAKMRTAWHDMIKQAFKENIQDGIDQIDIKLAGNAADAEKHLRFFDPSVHSPTTTFSEANVLWRAYPTSFGAPSKANYKIIDEPQLQFDTTIQANRDLRPQDEYCEWVVFRDGAKKITRVVFTSEPPEYYSFLYDPGPSYVIIQPATQKKLVELYQARCGDKSITLADLEISFRGSKIYDVGNKWNDKHCVHLQQPANTLGAQINIAARGAVVRKDSKGALITDVQHLLMCDGFGEATRQSDPSIGDNVNKLARENRFLTLENPVGLYVTSLDTTGWKTPDGTDAQTFWKVLRGKTDKDPRKSMIVRAEFSVPASKKYTVSDIKIAGVPIEFGAQIAEHLEMRLGARFGPKDKDLKGKTISAPTPVAC